jgi:hypothetical protein
MDITAHVNFDVLVYSGPWAELLKTRKPHPSVTGMNSAIDHEQDFHIDVAARMLSGFLSPYESATYSSQAECEAACQDVRGGINTEFRRQMQTTQSIEQGGGDPRQWR